MWSTFFKQIDYVFILNTCHVILPFESFLDAFCEGLLTDLRTAIVNNQMFARIAVRAGYQEHLRASSVSLLHDIRCFVENVRHSFGESYLLQQPSVPACDGDGEPSFQASQSSASHASSTSEESEDLFARFENCIIAQCDKEMLLADSKVFHHQHHYIVSHSTAFSVLFHCRTSYLSGIARIFLECRRPPPKKKLSHVFARGVVGERAAPLMITSLKFYKKTED